MPDFLVSIIFFVIGLVLGFYLLLFGRKSLVFTTAVIALAGTAGLLALIFLNENSGWALAESRDWLLIGITAGAAVIGGILGSRVERAATGLIGCFAGAYLGLWFYDIAHYLVVNIAHWSEQMAFTVGIVVIIAGALIGLFLTWRSEAIALILISVFMGADLIGRALNLNPEKSITAVIILSLALLGLVVQYAQYLRHIRAEIPNPFGHSTSHTPATEMFDLSDN